MPVKQSQDIGVRPVRWKQGFSVLALMLAFVTAGPALAASDSDEAIAERIGDGDPQAGKAKSLPCQACHGAEGNSSSAATPKLSGQYSVYLIKQFRRFQFGERKHDPNAAPATAVGSDDLSDIAAYFASQETTATGAGAAASNPTAESLFQRGDASRQILPCAGCHGASGKGAIAGSDSNPALRGQHSDYLRKQLIEWRSGGRTGSTAMSLMAKPLSDAEIDALATYVAGLR